MRPANSFRRGSIRLTRMSWSECAPKAIKLRTQKVNPCALSETWEGKNENSMYVSDWNIFSPQTSNHVCYDVILSLLHVS